MKSLKSIFVFIVMLFLVGNLSAQKSKEVYVKDELLVKFKDGTASRAAVEAHQLTGAKVVEEFPELGWQRIKLPKGTSVSNAENRYKNFADVETTQPNYYYHLLATPNDAQFSAMYGMNKISAPQAWDLNTGSSTVVVANIDTGMKLKTTIYIGIVALAILFPHTFVSAQKVDPKDEQRLVEVRLLSERIKNAASLSKSAQELQTKLINDHKTAIFEAVEIGDASLMPLIEIYAELGMYNADTALAKSGRTEYLTKIIRQTDKNSRIQDRYIAIRKLILIANRDSYQRLYELLDDTEVPVSPSGDEIYQSIASLVINQLSQTVSNPPALRNIYDTTQRINMWKKWFEEHKELTEGAETPKCDVVNTPTAKPISKTDNSFVNDILFTDYLSSVLLNKLF